MADPCGRVPAYRGVPLLHSCCPPIWTARIDCALARSPSIQLALASAEQYQDSPALTLPINTIVVSFRACWLRRPAVTKAYSRRLASLLEESGACSTAIPCPGATTRCSSSRKSDIESPRLERTGEASGPM